MTLRLSFILAALLAAASASSAQPAQRKAIVVAWDGIVPSFAKEMMARGLLPNLQQLLDGGSYADDVLAATPSKTAVGFASLWTGASPRVTGISGNRLPRAPAQQFTILETNLGFSGAALRAEPLWDSASRAGLRVVTLHAPLSGDKTLGGLHIQGYNRTATFNGVIDGRKAKIRLAANWQNLPASHLAPLEASFSLSGGSFYGLLIDDPDDPTAGYDTMLVTASRDGQDSKARLKPGRAGTGGLELWSAEVETKVAESAAFTYLRLFHLQNDGGDFLLYFTAPVRDNFAPASVLQELKAAAGMFVGNGGSFAYQQGALGTTLAQGGDGTAEARYLETVEFVTRHFNLSAGWVLATQAWDLLLAYSPFPDEAEHIWRGHLDSTLPGHRPELAAKLKPYLESVYQQADKFLGLFLAQRRSDTVVALISDHGMEGVGRWVAINRALQASGLQFLDAQGRVDLSRTKAFYPSISNGYLLINTTARKSGIVAPAERGSVVRELQRALFGLRDGDRPVVAALADAQIVGAGLGIGGETGGDIYIELARGYDFDSVIAPGPVVMQREPIGNHGYSPLRPAMRTMMVFNGPGVSPGGKLSNVSLTDFAPTLARLLAIPAPAQSSGQVLQGALIETR